MSFNTHDEVDKLFQGLQQVLQAEPMELTYLLMMGSLSGLVAVLAHSVIYSVVRADPLARQRRSGRCILPMRSCIWSAAPGSGCCSGSAGDWRRWSTCPGGCAACRSAMLCWVPLSLAGSVISTAPERGCRRRRWA